MPACYAHKKMGVQVYQCLPTEMRQLVKKHLPYFLIGLHGPDILSYNRFGFGKDVIAYGKELHREPFAEFYDNALMVIRNSEDDRSMVYFFGVLCHLYSDNLCHTYIREACKKLDVSHGKLETEYERHLLRKDGKHEMTYPSAAHIGIHPEYAHVIAPFYLGVSEEDILISLICMRSAFTATRTDSTLMRKAMCKVIQVSGHTDKVASMIMSRQESEICKPAMKKLDALMGDAVILAKEAIVDFPRHLYQTDEVPEYVNFRFSGITQ